MMMIVFRKKNMKHTNYFYDPSCWWISKKGLDTIVSFIHWSCKNETNWPQKSQTKVRSAFLNCLDCSLNPGPNNRSFTHRYSCSMMQHRWIHWVTLCMSCSRGVLNLAQNYKTTQKVLNSPKSCSNNLKCTNNMKKYEKQRRRRRIQTYQTWHVRMISIHVYGRMTWCAQV